MEEEAGEEEEGGERGRGVRVSAGREGASAIASGRSGRSSWIGGRQPAQWTVSATLEVQTNWERGARGVCCTLRGGSECCDTR